LDAEHENDPNTRVIDELALCGRVRVDVAVVNGYLAGFELKSERDNLRRLPTQVEVYSQVLDRATLVVAERHHGHAVDLLPEWWGVMIASHAGDGVRLDVERVGEVNGSVDPLAIVSLLWHAETLELLESIDAADGVRSKPRAAAWQRLVEAVETHELQGLVRNRLKARQGWRADR